MTKILVAIIFLCCASNSEAQHSHYVVLPKTDHLEVTLGSQTDKTQQDGLVLAFGNAPRFSFPFRTYHIKLDQYLNTVYIHPILSMKGRNQYLQHIYSDVSKTYIINTIDYGGLSGYYQMIILDSNKVILDTIYNNNYVATPTFVLFDRLNKVFLSIGMTEIDLFNFYIHLRVIDTTGKIIRHIDFDNLTVRFNDGIDDNPIGFTLLKDGSMLLLYEKSGIGMLKEFLVYKIKKDYTLESLEPKSIFKHLNIERIHSLTLMDDGRVRFIATGHPKNSNRIQERDYICTITPDGDSSDIVDVWEDERWAFKGNKFLQFGSMVPTSDGNLMYSIIIRDSITGNDRIGYFIVKADINYNILSPRIMPEFEGNTRRLVPTDDGGFFLVGVKDNPHPDKNHFMWIMRCDSNGKITSTKQFDVQRYQVEEIVISPNPATTQVHIESPIKIESYTLNNTSGTQVQSGVLENDNNIDITQLPQGIYFLQLQLENGQRLVKKLVRSY
jgi:hypothetical protein